MKKRLMIKMFCFIILGTIIYAVSYSKNNDFDLIGAYIDDEYTSSIPSESSGYVVEKVVCDNDAVGEWDYNDRGLLVKNMTKKSKCNIYFEKGIRLADTVTLVDTTGKCPTVNEDGTINVTSAESENSLLCIAPDNYGESYYFRGNVQNNYVYFAGFYWRIIRINGDGSIRMIYDGTNVHENGEASTDRQIGKSQFNSSCNDNAFIGYMYGEVSSSTYKKAHENINESIIKMFIDDWYKSNFLNTKYEYYLTDNSFLGNRSLGNGTENTGYSTTRTLYNWYYFANSSLKTSLHGLEEDNYTISSSTTGNNSLNYPIGLISMEEAVLGGAYNVTNNKFFLYSGTDYWTMSADSFLTSNNAAHNRVVNSSGCTGYCEGVAAGGGRTVTEKLGVKPVINLKANSIKSGNGTISNPFVLSND